MNQIRQEQFSMSVIVATTHPWPELEMTLESLWDQARAAGAQIIIADGNGRGVPADFGSRYPGVVYFERRGASVFLLRALGMQRARGELVAITEDHCRLPPDWCGKLIETHRRYPQAAAVGGAVENGPVKGLIDWANFFVAHSPMMLPVRGGEARLISLQAGMALKRRFVPAEIPPEGLMEMLYVPELRKRGGKLILNDRILVHHVQSHGFWRTFAIHYHNGRSIAGFRKPRIGAAERLLRICGCFLLPGFLTLRTIRIVVGKRRFLRELALSLPLIAGLACCHAAGEFAGYCAGAGGSPAKLS